MLNSVTGISQYKLIILLKIEHKAFTHFGIWKFYEYIC